jgi:hypothetical protein
MNEGSTTPTRAVRAFNLSLTAAMPASSCSVCCVLTKLTPHSLVRRAFIVLSGADDRGVPANQQSADGERGAGLGKVGSQLVGGRN